jgi:Tfp pilus assembly protein PilN
MSVQSVPSPAKSKIRRQSWLTGVLPLIILAVFVAEMVALKWDRDDRTKQLDRLESEMKQLESRINAADRAVEERQRQASEKDRAPEKAKPEVGVRKSGGFDGVLTPVIFS